MHKYLFFNITILVVLFISVNCKTVTYISQNLQSQEEKDKVLVEMVKSGDAEKVKEILEKGANSNCFYQIPETNTFQTILGLAVDKKNVAISQLLLKNGANVDKNTFSIDKNTSLEDRITLNFRQSVTNQDIQTMKLLEENGANLEKDNNNLPIIHLAKTKEVFDFLLANGFDINTRDNFHGRTPLFEAVFNHDLELVKLISQYKPNFYHY